LGLGARERLERDIPEFPRELKVAFSEHFNLLAWIACKHSFLDNCVGRCFILFVRNEEKISRQH
jgi:hypothetical protein